MLDLVSRVRRRASRDLRLAAARARYGASTFGAGCDVRRGLHLVRDAAAEINFGAGCVLDRNMTVECLGLLQVGAGTIFGHHCTVGVKDAVVIGEHCLIAEMVSIRDNDHVFDDPDRPYVDQGHHTAPVTLGDNVWLGSKVVVARGVTIGRGAVVGAGAVVTRDIPAGAVAVGVPARVVRQR